jgi:hypothetical protein
MPQVDPLLEKKLTYFFILVYMYVHVALQTL